MDNIFDILDKNLVRSDKLGDWKSPDIFNYQYWEVRSVLPDLILEGFNELTLFIQKKFNLSKKIDQKSKISFYFWMKDELEKVANFERQMLTPVVIQNSNIKPSPRAREFGKLLELKKLSNGNPILAAEIKKLEYGEVLDMLIAMVVESEAKYEKR